MNLDKLKEKMNYAWRVQSIKDYGADCVAYIDSRDVQDRLDEVVGAENWQCDYKDVKGVVYCGIAIKSDNGEWVWKWDAGSESNIEKEKGEASDSFKRAAVKWGIGRFLYDLDVVRLKVIKYKEKNYPLNEATGKALFSGSELTEYINSIKGNKARKTPENASNGKPELIEDTDAFREVIKALKGKKCDMKYVESKFTLSQPIRLVLQAAIPQPQNN